MSIYQTAVKKPVSTILIFVGLAIMGVFAFTRLPLDLYPSMDMNRIMVITAYPGAGGTEVESNVTKTIENSLNAVANLKHITSQSKENMSVVSLEFNEGIDIDVATNDVRDKLDAVSQNLPEGISQPFIFKFGTDDIPIMIISAQAKESLSALEKILNDKVATPLARVDGVGGVFVSGAPIREVQVYCNPAKLEAYGLTIAQIAAVISSQNRNVSAGVVDFGNETTSFRVQGEFQDPRELSSLVIGSFRGGNIYLSDVAEVRDTLAERMQYTFNNNVSSASIIITKQSGSNTVNAIRDIKKELPAIIKTLPSDIQLNTIMDGSTNILNSLSNLGETIGITFLVVMIVVLFFLRRWRATVIIMVTIPISLLGSFIYLMLTGSTLNIISMSSLSIAIGMVVDDAIVVLENITTHIERGSYPGQAAVHATREVAISVIASTLTMLAVFLPLTMVEGKAGMLFAELGWMVSIVMIISTVCALTLTPTLCAHMLRRRHRNARAGRGETVAPRKGLDGAIEKILSAVDSFYVRTLTWCLRHRKTTIFGALGFFVVTLLFAGKISTEFMPASDNSYASASIEFPVGTRVEITKERMSALVDMWLKKYPEVKYINYSTGQASADNAFASIQNNGANIASFNISFVDPDERSKTLFELSDEMRQDIRQIPGVKKFTVTPGGGGFGGGQTSVDLEIYGYDFETTTALANQFIAQIKENPACASVTSNRDEFLPEYNVRFDNRKLAEVGLNQATAASYLYNALNGSLASYYREEGEEYPIRVRLAPEFRTDMQQVMGVMVKTPTGANVRLSELGTVETIYTPPTIQHKDRIRTVTIKCVAKAGTPLSDLVTEVQNTIEGMDVPQDITYKLAGSFEDQQESFGQMFVLLVLIILLVFIVMATEFESLRDPFVIMFAVPFSFSGVILGLVLTGVSLSLIAVIGAIMLVGIVVKNGIVLIDYTRLCRERNMGIIKACASAGRSRLRPVLMTTLTTVFGMVPMALGIGEGAEMWQPMGITVACGLTVSTMVTLVLIPTIYASFLGISTRSARKKHRRAYLKQLKYAQKHNA